MQLMSKLGERVSSSLLRGRRGMECVFVLSLKGANDEIPVLPSSGKREIGSDVEREAFA